MSPSQISNLNSRVDALETLVMKNLPRIASLESWQRDCRRDIDMFHDWIRSRKHELHGHNFRLTRLEKRTNVQSPACVTVLDDTLGLTEDGPYVVHDLPPPSEPATKGHDFYLDETGPDLR